jgi:hypothetical protein
VLPASAGRAAEAGDPVFELIRARIIQIRDLRALSLSLSLLSPFSTPSFSFIFRTRPRHLFSLYMQPFIGYWALQGWTPKALGQHLPYRVLPPVSFAPLSPHPGAIALAAGIWGLGSLGRGMIFRDGRAKFWESLRNGFEGRRGRPDPQNRRIHFVPSTMY